MGTQYWDYDGQFLEFIESKQAETDRQIGYWPNLVRMMERGLYGQIRLDHVLSIQIQSLSERIPLFGMVSSFLLLVKVLYLPFIG